MNGGAAHAGRPLRVALLNPVFFPEVRRGSERIICELATGLISRGHRPHLITSHRGRPSRAVEEGLPITRHWRPPEERLTRRRIQQYLTHLPFSYASLRTGDYDLAHAFYFTDAVATARWARRTGRPAILSYMGLADRPVLASHRLRLRVLSCALHEADAVVTLSKAAAAGMRRWFGIEPRVIYPGVDLRLFRPMAGRDPQPTIFCGADPEDGRKRVGLLAAGFSRLRRELPDARLLVIRPRDRGTIGRLGLDADGIELIEPMDRAADVAAVYARAWISALTSYREAFGLVLVEALACGKPVVAGRSGAVAEIFDGNSVGVLFEDDQPESVARALREALALADDASVAAACRSSAERFSTERTTEEHLALYWELTEKNG